MYTLALDTSGYKIRLALAKGNAIVFERIWTSEMNEDETIAKTLQNLMEREPFFLQKLDRILINEGPGTLTGTRIGVAIANALSFATRATLAKLDTFGIYKLRLTDEQKKQKPHHLLRITEQEVFFDGKIVQTDALLKSVQKAKKQEFIAYGELTPAQLSLLRRIKNAAWIMEPDLRPWSDIIGLTKDKGSTKYASPRYAKPPTITESKKKPLVERPLKKLPQQQSRKSAKSKKSAQKQSKKNVKKSAKKTAKRIAPKKKR